MNNTDYEFQIALSSKYLDDFTGIIDIYDIQNKSIIEIKFTKNTSLLHYLQLFLYNFIKNNSIGKIFQITFRIFNI